MVTRLFVRAHLEEGRPQLNRLIKEVLYEKVPVKRTVGRDAFERNPTLDAILTFCAARPGTALASASKYEIEANSKVGGLLTTNYDNLVEGAFHTKYRRNLLKPVGRPASREAARDRRVIPVYHIHGYISYRPPDPTQTNQRTPDIVIAEDDFFQTFYDPLGFGNYIAMSFLRRFPCLFVGSALTDPNLRRFLFHLARNGGRASAPHKRKFALLKVSGTANDALTEAVLRTYGVDPIWIQDFDEILDILRTLYTTAAGVEESDWEEMTHYKW